MNLSKLLVLSVLLSLPFALQSQSAEIRVKCGTPLELGVTSFQKQKTARLQTSNSYRSASGRFIVYYDIVGRDAVPNADNNGNGRPDYVESVANYADESYAKTIGYGFPDPLTSSNQPYHIYIEYNASAYGYMQTDPTKPHGSFMAVNSDLEGFNPQLNTEELLQVTVAHEFKHVVQLHQTGLSTTLESTRWREYDAALMEDVIYDDANDYHLFVGTSQGIFRSPDVAVRPASMSELGKGYYKMTFNHYFYEVFGIDFWVDVWARIEANKSLPLKVAMTSELEERGTTWEEEFTRMFLWHSATIDDFSYNYGFGERASFPVPTKKFDIGINSNIQQSNKVFTSNPVQPTASDLFEVAKPLFSDPLYVVVFPRNKAITSGVLEFKTGGGVEEKLFNSDQDFHFYEIPETSTEKVEFAVTNTSVSSTYQYDLLVGRADSYDLFTWGDANNDGALSSEDATIIIRNLTQPTQYQLSSLGAAAANVSGQASLSPFDAAIILRESSVTNPVFNAVDDNNDNLGPDASFFEASTNAIAKEDFSSEETVLITEKSYDLSSSVELSLERLTGSTVSSFYLELEVVGSNLSFDNYDFSGAQFPNGSIVNAAFDVSSNLIRIAAAFAQPVQLSSLGSLDFSDSSTLSELKLVRGFFDERATGFKQVDGQLLSVESDFSDHPDQIQLYQNYPNPFNPTTQIQFDLPQASNVRLDVLNSVGQRVATLADQAFTAGTHTRTFDARGLASGVYTYILVSDNTRIIKRMTLIR